MFGCLMKPTVKVTKDPTGLRGALGECCEGVYGKPLQQEVNDLLARIAAQVAAKQPAKAVQVAADTDEIFAQFDKLKSQRR